MKVIVAGSRSFDDYRRLCEVLLKQFGLAVEIVSGGARGADRLAERFAAEHDVPITVMRAEWDKYGKRAGFVRNLDMAQAGDVLVAFWDGASPGTRHMIGCALEHGLEVHVYRFRNDGREAEQD